MIEIKDGIMINPKSIDAIEKEDCYVTIIVSGHTYNFGFDDGSLADRVVNILKELQKHYRLKSINEVPPILSNMASEVKDGKAIHQVIGGEE